MNDCGDVCSDRAFLFKLIELALLLLSWWGVSDFSLDYELEWYYIRIWAGAGGLTLVLILICIYLFNEPHYLTEVMFLFIYGVLLICSGIMMLFAVRKNWILRGLLGGLATIAAGGMMITDAILQCISN